MSKLVLRDFRAVTKNSLRGFATFEFPNGMVISDMPVHVKNDSAWVMFPSIPQLDNGTHKKSPEGKGLYKKVIEWRDRELSERFSAAAIEIIKRDKPEVL